MTADRLKREKKRMIERECGGLLEFLSPELGLDALVGAEGAKRRLRHDARFIQEGRLEAVPMGYLLCGAVGTGKSFLAECFSGEVGIPCVKLLNFRSKYVGETESNLEKILTVLRSMGPVAVIIDEADAALGDREATGDAGTSGRVFALIASQMGNTRYRGRILWFLITCRPDLLPIDLKRQGRAEVHIPLFPPGTAQEAGDMIRALAGKNDVPLEEGVPDEDLAARGVGLSGADLEGVLLRAWRRALEEGSETVGAAHLEEVLSGFLPSTDSLERELQTLAAINECTDLVYLPEKIRKQLEDPEERGRIRQRLDVLKAALS